MQAIEIQADITQEGQIFLPPPYRDLYGRQARMILLFDEMTTGPAEETERGKPRPSHPRPAHPVDPSRVAGSAQGVQEMLTQKLRDALPGLLAVYLARRPAQGAEDETMELAVLLEGFADPVVLWSLADDLSALAGGTVIPLDLRNVPTIRQHHVITTGERLWGVEPQAGMFECFVLSEDNTFGEMSTAC
ncbi:MAG: hypothetical protein HQL96_05185 [Magnetococcales bacterium]|nr:hypothetical protein [Magnetococcales bacterium]